MIDSEDVEWEAEVDAPVGETSETGDDSKKLGNEKQAVKYDLNVSSHQVVLNDVGIESPDIRSDFSTVKIHFVWNDLRFDFLELHKEYKPNKRGIFEDFFQPED